MTAPRVGVTLGDMLKLLAAREGELFDACVTDPPYHLSSIVKRFGKEGSAEAKVGATGAYARASKGFMGKEWDGGDIAFRPETWRAVYDQLKPGAHLIAFSGTRTYHRMACAIEDAGFEIRDQLAWCYGSGFPKSHDVSKGIDKAAGAKRETIETRKAAVGFDTESEGGGGWAAGEIKVTTAATPEAAQWEGWGTALKPAWEPICLARKPLSEKSIAANVLKWGTGALNIDGCRIEGGGWTRPGSNAEGGIYGCFANDAARENTKGRWPANILHDGSDEVLAGFPDETGKSAGTQSTASPSWLGTRDKGFDGPVGFGDSGSAARFFYSAKAGPLDRIGTYHATVKPVDVMRWLVRMVTPPGGLILEPFAGSGTTGIAALAEGFRCEMLELDPEHVADIERKLAFLRGEGRLALAEHLNGREAEKEKRAPSLPMLDWLDS